MKCPHLMKWSISSCKALDKPYVPSMFELEEYCSTEDHRKCPFFLKDVIKLDALEHTGMPVGSLNKNGAYLHDHLQHQQ